MKNTLAITPEAAKAIDAVEKMNSEWDGAGSAAKLVRPDEIQKFEEIKKKAWEVYKVYILTPMPDELKHLSADKVDSMYFQAAWKTAEKFYAFAKEKEKAHV